MRQGGCLKPGAEDQDRGDRTSGLVSVEATGARTPREESVGKEALEMIVVLGTRSLRKGLWDPVQWGMEVSTETQNLGEGALGSWRGLRQEMQSAAEGRDSQEPGQRQCGDLARSFPGTLTHGGRPLGNCYPATPRFAAAPGPRLSGHAGDPESLPNEPIWTGHVPARDPLHPLEDTVSPEVRGAVFPCWLKGSALVFIEQIWVQSPP